MSAIKHAARPQSALALDGVDDYCIIPHHSKFDSIKAIEFMVFVRSYNDSGSALRINAFITKRLTGSSESELFFFCRSDKRNTLIISWGGLSTRWDTGYTIPLNKWTRIVVQLADGGDRQLVVNGEVVASTTTPARALSNSDLYIGKDSASAQYYTDAIFKYVRFWGDSTPIASYNMDDCEGTTLVDDDATNPIHGFIAGATWRYYQPVKGVIVG
ncbi:LamG-like jellyroll fold domain-containing protein [Aureibacillus halotolerans]|uniref:Concanavalin A-like lectin/glucanase superfamily protein n=1 Tax=Aureibacillus halotolerans TaxID=1508390 RepID=A0A4R6U3Z3_9BACI|nr:LamG-like jellyroll fold domain-containing protein [Aureibacillus halotolerans]TDQ39239.1 concanavalin A-like lectin/glucanase superfamily protein [Aureibacillus halotolerans]